MQRVNYAIHLSDEIQPFRCDLPCDFVYRRRDPSTIGFRIVPGAGVSKDSESEGMDRFENEGGSLGDPPSDDPAIEDCLQPRGISRSIHKPDNSASGISGSAASGLAGPECRQSVRDNTR
jgi:hypothetical protein